MARIKYFNPKTGKWEYADSRYVVDSGGNVDQSGLTAEQINALNGMFKVCAFIKDDVAAEYTAFKTAFGIADEGEPDVPVTPDEPDEPEVTLSSISAKYSGGDVTVGTAVTDLTGIVVTAHYSDGSTAPVTGYILSGEIAEGENTVTVTYEGMTTTFAVIGVAESGGEVVNDTTAKIAAYGYGLASSGNPKAKDDMCYTELYDISDILENPTGNYGYLYGAFKSPESPTTSTDYVSGNVYKDGTYKEYKNMKGLFTPEGTQNFSRLTIADYADSTKVEIRVPLYTEYIDDSYLYIGGNGRVIFAGKNTQYYNMTNIDGTPYSP